MMSKNSIVPFLKDYLINFLTSPFLLDTNDQEYKISYLIFSVNYVIKNWKPVNTATNNDI